MHKRYYNLEKTSYWTYIKKKLIMKMPGTVFQKLFGNNEYYSLLRMYYDFSKGKNAKKNKSVIVKEEIPQFNFWVYNKLLGMIGYFTTQGMKYQIEVTAEEEHFNILKEFFAIKDEKVDEPDAIYALHEDSIWNIDQFNVFDRFERELMCAIYRKNFRLTEQFKEYVEEDLRIIYGKRVLGVLMRGTDYTRKKPHGHPIQPDKEEMLQEILSVLEKKQYPYIYLTTDEKENETYLRDKLKGKCQILVNRRQYFDRFYQADIPYISSCRHERESDRLYTSMEYLSSVIVLANCAELIAGNCGGSRAAIYINDGKYADIFLFDKGRYA